MDVPLSYGSLKGCIKSRKFWTYFSQSEGFQFEINKIDINYESSDKRACEFCQASLVWSPRWYQIVLSLSYVVPVKSKMKISQNFVAFSKYINFNGK